MLDINDYQKIKDRYLYQLSTGEEILDICLDYCPDFKSVENHIKNNKKKWILKLKLSKNKLDNIRYEYAKNYRLEDISKKFVIPEIVLELLKNKDEKTDKRWVRGMKNKRLRLEIIEKYKRGYTISRISRETRIDESTIRNRRNKANERGNPWL